MLKKFFLQEFVYSHNFFGEFLFGHAPSIACSEQLWVSVDICVLSYSWPPFCLHQSLKMGSRDPAGN